MNEQSERHNVTLVIKKMEEEFREKCEGDGEGLQVLVKFMLKIILFDHFIQFASCCVSLKPHVVFTFYK